MQGYEPHTAAAQFAHPPRSGSTTVARVTTPAPRRQGRRSAADAQQTKALLLSVADRLFAERGFAQTSIRDLATAAGVTSGAIYGHFRDKADLLAEVIHQRITSELESEAIGAASDHVQTLTRQATRYKRRRRLRALLVQGAAAAQTDAETKAGLRAEQQRHIDQWIAGYQRERARLGIDPSVDIEAALLYTWAVELGLGMLESVGIEPRRATGWADVHNRMARSLRLPPE